MRQIDGKVAVSGVACIRPCRNTSTCSSAHKPVKARQADRYYDPVGQVPAQVPSWHAHLPFAAQNLHWAGVFLPISPTSLAQ